MKTIDADELIKALEAERDEARTEAEAARNYNERAAWRNYMQGIQHAIDTTRKLAEQADNVGELPY